MIVLCCLTNSFKTEHVLTYQIFLVLSLFFEGSYVLNHLMRLILRELYTERTGPQTQSYRVHITQFLIKIYSHSNS